MAPVLRSVRSVWGVLTSRPAGAVQRSRSGRSKTLRETLGVGLMVADEECVRVLGRTRRGQDHGKAQAEAGEKSDKKCDTSHTG